MRILILFAIQLLLVTHASAQPTLERAFPNLSFNRPVDLQHAGDGSNRLFVVEQAGRILVFPNTADAEHATVFLDITARVNNQGNEEGLLGLAFHPDYATNGYFFVNYTARDPRRTVIARYTVSPTQPDIANNDSELLVLQFDQPFSNHNGGQIAFGKDGFLYIATGDGGSGGDPQNNAQNRRNLLGNILRIDVDRQENGMNYGIPEDNPLAGNDGGLREEIWAYGLRNPWRFSFDSVTGTLWTGDVGQNRFEEINIVEKGKNYGWRIMEGFACYNPPSGCDQSGLELPILDYGRADGASITGGYVYRGSDVPFLYGKYVYGDFVSGRIWVLEYNGPDELHNSLLLSSGLNIASFGVDQTNELYCCAFDGNIYRFAAGATAIDVPSKPSSVLIDSIYPQPAMPSIHHSLTVRFRLPFAASIRLLLHDMLGRNVLVLTEGQFNEGTHTVVTPTRVLSPGLFYLSLETQDMRTVRKLLVME